MVLCRGSRPGPDFFGQRDRHHPAGIRFRFPGTFPVLRLRFWDLVLALVLLAVVVSPMPLTLLLAKHGSPARIT